jgi:hypothetical protein
MGRFWGKKEPEKHGDGPSKESPGVGLRLLALTSTAGALGFSPDPDFPRVYGVLTDRRLGDHVASIMSMRDGTASLYTTSTFGIIGGQAHESVGRAAVEYVKITEEYFERSEQVTGFPLPTGNEVFYCLLGYDGVRRCVGDAVAVRELSDETTPCLPRRRRYRLLCVCQPRCSGARDQDGKRRRPSRRAPVA